MEHATVNPPHLTYENISNALLQTAEAITTQEQAVTAQAQAMTAQANGEVMLVLINKSILWIPV